MKQNRNYQILAWILAFLPAVAVAALYSRLPDQLPMQWDFGGQVRYEPKWHIWIIAGMAPLFCAMFSVLPKIDPRRRNYAKFGEAYQGFQCMMMVFLTVMVGIVLTEGLRPRHGGGAPGSHLPDGGALPLHRQPDAQVPAELFLRRQNPLDFIQRNRMEPHPPAGWPADVRRGGQSV